MTDVIHKLRERGRLDDAAARRVAAARDEGMPLDRAILTASGLPETQALECLGDEFGVEVADLEKSPPSADLVARFPARVLLHHQIVPMRESEGSLVVAVSGLSDTAGIDELRLLAGLPVVPALAPADEIARTLKRVLGVGADTMQSLVSVSGGVEVVKDSDEEGEADLSRAAEDASIIKFVNQILAEAIEVRATDVHLEPFEGRFRVRYRVDGVLIEANIPADVRRFQAAIVSRIKILSQLDIAEKRLPQDGRIKLKVAGREVDVRVSIIPMLHGEAVVLRLLDRGGTVISLDGVGMSPRDRRLFERVLDLPHGIILVTGPTGSGKTTTLYAGLQHINNVDQKIVTIEDPIEYHLDGINQIQVSTKSGLTFAKGLRSILRHDPDVILIGEIRDHETAEIAVQASLTGHLVFSTLHTNDAPGALTRLIDMGIEPYLVASSLELVVAQRLVRLICAKCRTPVPASELDEKGLRAELGDRVPRVMYRGAGCRDCRGTGFRGRTGIFEIMPMNDAIRSRLLDRASAGELRRLAVEAGMRSLREDGRRLVIEGLTTLDEVLRVSKDETASFSPIDAEPGK